MEFVSYDIASNDFRRAGAASRAIKEHLKRIGADAEAIRRTMIAAYEAEMNVVIHSVGGRLQASLSDARVDVDVVDAGPGIADVEQAMVPGFSTADAEARALGFGAGMGLPNIKDNSDRLRITSRPGEGTRVSFTVHLKPASADGARPTSLYASPDRCRDCRACLTACPTQAMRVRDGRPSVLEHLCVDCAECIGVCSTQALAVRDEISSLDDIPDREEALLVVPPALLAGCGPDYSPAQVLAALRGLGFAGVITAAPYEDALRRAAVESADDGRCEDDRGPAGPDAAAGPVGAAEPGAPAAQAGPRGPLIVPACPAVVNLIELRFPALVPLLAPFDSPWEAIQAFHGDRPVVYTVSCPAQRSALIAHTERDGGTRAEYVTPELVRQAAMVRLTSGISPEHAPDGEPAAPVVSGGAATPGAGAAAAAAGAPIDGAQVEGASPLTVTGMRHVTAILEEVEDGLLGDVSVIEPYACEGGCFGSPLLPQDHHVAARRWSRGHGTAAGAGGTAATAVPRRQPFAARPGIRLDSNMSRAIERLGRMQQVIRSLPGRDCGACGAPTCAALAEDVVMQRAGVELCPYLAVGNGAKEDRGQ